MLLQKGCIPGMVEMGVGHDHCGRPDLPGKDTCEFFSVAPGAGINKESGRPPGNQEHI